MFDYVLLTRLAASLTLAMLLSKPLLDRLGVPQDLARTGPSTQRLFKVVVGGVALQALGCGGLTFWYAPELVAAKLTPIYFAHVLHWLYRLGAQIWYSQVWPLSMRRAHNALISVMLSMVALYAYTGLAIYFEN